MDIELLVVGIKPHVPLVDSSQVLFFVQDLCLHLYLALIDHEVHIRQLRAVCRNKPIKIILSVTLVNLYKISREASWR